jgi:alpha-L-arabinofuranosidase
MRDMSQKDGWSDWDYVVLRGLARIVDYHAIHIYTGSHDYYSNVFAPHQVERALRITGALIEQVRYEQSIDHQIKVAYDEWNVWFRTRSLEDRQSGIEEQYTLADALAVATFLNVFVRQSQVIGMANIAQMVNAIAPIFTNREGLFLQTIFHPLKLYSDHMQGIALERVLPHLTAKNLALSGSNSIEHLRMIERLETQADEVFGLVVMDTFFQTAPTPAVGQAGIGLTARALRPVGRVQPALEGERRRGGPVVRAAELEARRRFVAT